MQLVIRNFMLGIFGEIPASCSKWLDILDHQAVRLSHLLDDFRDAADMELGCRLRISKENIDIANTAESMEQKYSSVFARSGINLIFEKSAGSLIAECDGRILERIISGLLDRGLRSSRKGDTIKFSVRSRAGFAAEVSVEHRRLLSPAVEKGPAPILEKFFACSGSGAVFMLGFDLYRRLAGIQGWFLEIAETGQAGTERVILKIK